MVLAAFECCESSAACTLTFCASILKSKAGAASGVATPVGIDGSVEGTELQ